MSIQNTVLANGRFLIEMMDGTCSGRINNASVAFYDEQQTNAVATTFPLHSDETPERTKQPLLLASFCRWVTQCCQSFKNAYARLLPTNGRIPSLLVNSLQRLHRFRPCCCYGNSPATFQILCFMTFALVFLFLYFGECSLPTLSSIRLISGMTSSRLLNSQSHEARFGDSAPIVDEDEPKSNAIELIVHLDLKGAPPKVNYLVELFPLFHSLGATGLLIEWEDMFPFTGSVLKVRTKYAYNRRDVGRILHAANENNLKVIPLVQTFGHMEWVLKHEEFAHLREVDSSSQSLCPSHPETILLVRELIDQIVAHQPGIETIHIGADEVKYLGYDDRCQKEMRSMKHSTKEQLYLRHVVAVADYAKRRHGLTVLMWNDHIATFNVSLLQQYNIGEFVEPVIWGYAPTFQPGYFPEGSFARMGKTFDNVWIATAFKGANGMTQTFVDIERYQRNHATWLEEIALRQQDLSNLKGVILTGWQRFWHFTELCELLPVAVPSLAVNILTLQYGMTLKHRRVLKSAKQKLNCSRYSSINDWNDCTFPGVEIYRLVDTLKMYLSGRPSVADWLRLGRRLKSELRKVYFEDAAIEWLYQNVQKHINALINRHPNITKVGDETVMRAIPSKSDLTFW